MEQQRNVTRAIIQASTGMFSDYKLVGSVAKGTKLYKLDEFDILIFCSNTACISAKEENYTRIFDQNCVEIQSKTLLEKLKIAVSSALTQLNIEHKLEIHSVAVTVMTKQMNFDFIPTISLQNGLHFIPDGHNCWKQSFWQIEIEEINKREKFYPQYKHVILLLKHIKVVYKWNVMSFTLECLAYYYTQTIAESTWRIMSLRDKLIGILQYFQFFLKQKVMQHIFYPQVIHLRTLYNHGVLQT
jgi:hypothetical protein